VQTQNSLDIGSSWSSVVEKRERNFSSQLSGFYWLVCLSPAHFNQSQQLHSLWLTVAIRLGETVLNPCNFIVGVLLSLNIILFRQSAFFFGVNLQSAITICPCLW